MNRYRRLRVNESMRSLVKETHLVKAQLVQPFFVVEGSGKKEAIESMPGIFRYSHDRLLKAVEQFIKLGGKAGLLFGVPSKKDKQASGAFNPSGVVPKAVKAIKKHFPNFLVMTDVCLCAYTDHGHCGILTGGEIDNDRSLPVLGKMALAHAEAGADIVAPSDMMDFRIREIRSDLDQNSFINTSILSYAVLYFSTYYCPFR